jgi:hypothetical protein
MFLAFVELPFRSFSKLLLRFTMLYSRWPRKTRPGRRVNVAPHQALAVVLMFYCSTADAKFLGLVHNLTPRRINRIIAKCEPILNLVLRYYPDAKIEWPSFEMQRHAARRIQSAFPLVPGRFGFVDGKNLTVMHSGNVDRQNSQYNGWLHDCFVSGVLVFDASGLLIWCKHNCPGSWNDSEMSRELQMKLQDPNKTIPEYGLCADTAFPVGPDLFRHIISPLKEGELEMMDPRLQPAASLLSASITSLRQACEWGMGSIQKPFKRLLLDLPWRENVRAMRLGNIFHLWNVRVRCTGISQIHNVFGD